MPVSKKRKKKGQKLAGPPQKVGQVPQKKLTKQRLILYIISAVMIISLAASFVVSGSGGGTSSQPVPHSDIVTEPPATGSQEENPTSGEGVPADEDGQSQDNGETDN